jgi:hypothetical protein
MTHLLWKFDLTDKAAAENAAARKSVVPTIERPTLKKNPEKPHATPKSKQGLDHMNQSSFDCIFAGPLATPNNRQGTNKGRLHGRDASCTIDEHRKSVSVAKAGPDSGRRRRPGGAATP